MKHQTKKFFILLIVSIVYSGCSKESKVENKPEPPSESKPSRTMYQADPTIFSFNGTYYLYGTNDESPNDGFQVFTSTNMETWQGPKGAKNGYALSKGDAFGNVGFWAPQVWHYDNKFYMAYTADEKIAIATSSDPLGPFINTKTPIASTVKQIDPFIFIDDDGKKYLYHVRLIDGNRIFVAEMEDDFSAIKVQTLKECITGTQPWENAAQNTWTVVEGPTVVKHKGLYYMVYSANDFRNRYYAVGYAVSEKPDGPWVKFEGNPILSIHNTKEAGSGHGDMVKDKDGKMFYVFHTHNTSTQPVPRKSAIAPAKFIDKGTEADELVIEGDKFYHIKSK